MRPNRMTWLAAIPLCAATLVCSPVQAQHGEHDHNEHEETEFSQPTTYSDAVGIVEHRMDRIKNLITSGELDGVHAEAAVIRDVAKTMARLALEEDSGVPRSAIREINLTAKDLAATFGPIDEAGDSGDRAGTQKVYDQMVALLEILESHVPKQYVCPMGCEPGTTYNQPQACPVCGMQLKLLTDEQYDVKVASTSGTIRVGEETTLTFQITDPARGPVHDLRAVHEKLLHLLMVSKDLSWYAHEHPTRQRDGSFTLAFTFPRAGDFVLFHDFTPEGAGTQVVPVTLHVEGTPPPTVELATSNDLTRVVDGYTVRLDTNGALSAEHEAVLAYDISRNGKPVTDLEPYLGATGHLVIISQDLKHYVHSHPLGGAHDDESTHHEADDADTHREQDEHGEHGGMVSGARSTIVSFHAQFPAGGLYKAWLQFQHEGRVQTVPFVIRVDGGGNHQAEADHHDH